MILNRAPGQELTVLSIITGFPGLEVLAVAWVVVRASRPGLLLKYGDRLRFPQFRD